MMNQKLSLNQQKCHIYDESFIIAYSKDISQDPIEAAIKVIDVVEVLRPHFYLLISMGAPNLSVEALILKL